MPRFLIAVGFKLAADAPSTRERAVGSALGSGISNLVTGTAAAPFLFADPERRFSMKALRASPKKHLKKIYGPKALRLGAVTSAAALVGGGIRESVQAGFEGRKKKASDGRDVAGGAAIGAALAGVGAAAPALLMAPFAADPKGIWRTALKAGGKGAVVGALAGGAIAHARRKKASTAGSPVGHSGDLLRVSKNVAAPVGVEDKVPPSPRKKGTALERFIRSRSKKASDGLASVEQGAEGGTSRIETRGVTGPTDGVRVSELYPRKDMARRRTTRHRAVYNDNQVVKISEAEASEKHDIEEEVGPVNLYAKPGSTGREQKRLSRGKSQMRSARRRVDHEFDPGVTGTEKVAEQFGIMVYQRDPGEMPESKAPPKPKGRIARMFGNRMDPNHALHRRAKREEDEWMGENGEFVEVGRRPGLREALQDVVGVEGDQVLSRSDVAKMLAERKQAKSSAYGRRKQKRKAKEHVHTHAPEDMSELFKTFEGLMENPASKYFQVIG